MRRSCRSTSRAEIPPGRDAQGVRHLPPASARATRSCRSSSSCRATCRKGRTSSSSPTGSSIFTDERTAKPFRFTAESARRCSPCCATWRRSATTRSTSACSRQPDGVAIGRTAMPNLPSSRREVLLGAGRSNTTPFVSSTVESRSRPEISMQGAAQFEVTIDKNARVETGTGKSAGARHDAPPTATPSTPQSPPKPRRARAAVERAKAGPEARRADGRTTTARSPRGTGVSTRVLRTSITGRRARATTYPCDSSSSSS